MGASHSKQNLEINTYLNGKKTARSASYGGTPAPAPAPAADQRRWSAHPAKLQEQIVGDQPEGDMKWMALPRSLPCYPHCGTIEIQYDIMDGIQKRKHPKPGKPFTGLRAVAYLPDDEEGQRMLQLLRQAFEQRLTFTVVTGSDGTEVVTWSDIPHCSGFSNPDPQYMMSLKQALKSKGIE